VAPTHSETTRTQTELVEGVFGPQPLLQRPPLLVAQRSNEDGWSHIPERTTFSFTYSEEALVESKEVACHLDRTSRTSDQTEEIAEEMSGPLGQLSLFE
jgi:hypothetical protein